jgi:hypothetical protein
LEVSLNPLSCLTNRRLLPYHAQQSHCHPWVSQGGTIQWLPYPRYHAPSLCAHSSSLCPIKSSIRTSKNTIASPIIHFEAVHFLCHWNCLCRVWSVLPELLYPFVPTLLSGEQPHHLEVHARDQNLPPNITNYLLAILNGASAVGRVFPNFIADYFGSLNLLIVMGTGSGILAFSVFGADTAAGSVVVAVLYGFFSGGYQSLVGPTLISMATHPSEIGMRLGIGTSD